jgi:hypothetical protein
MAEHLDSEELLNAVLPFAHQMLEKNGDFYPFGASIATEGEITHDMAHTGEEFPPSQELIDALKSIYGRRVVEGEIRGCAICYDVRISLRDKGVTDAICVDIEHATEGAVRIVQPYEKAPDGGVLYSDVSGSLLEPMVFDQQR